MIEGPGVLRGGEFVTTETLNERGLRAATGLRELGVTAGDTIAMLLRNDHPFFEASIAAGVVGAVPVAVNWHGKPAEILYVVRDCGAKVLVAHADLIRPLIGQLPDGLEVRIAPTPSDIGEAYGIAKEAWDVPEGMTEWLSWVGAHEPWTDAAADAPMTMIYTSGTTGQPRGVRRPAPSEEFRRTSPYIADLARAMGFVPGARGVVTGPMYHGAPNAWAMGWLRVNGTVLLQPRFDAEDLLRIIEGQRVTHLLLVPIMFTRLVQLPDEVRRRYDTSSLQHIGTGAAPCPRHIKLKMIEYFGPIIEELYGSMEMGIVTTATSGEWLSHPGTAGRPLHGADLRILDEQGNEVPTGEMGEIYARIAGYPEFVYQGRPDARAEIVRDGYVTGGDVGYVDEDGFLYLCDRKKDMVISGGVNIYPAEIEFCLIGMPGVRDVAVFGIPDDEYGESLAAAVELDGTASVTVDDVRNYVRANLASYKTPRVVEFYDELPREDTGKIFKRKLRDVYWAETGRAI